MKPQMTVEQIIEKNIEKLKDIIANPGKIPAIGSIVQDLELVDRYVKSTINALEGNLDSFINNINLLSDLTDLQQHIFSSAESKQLLDKFFNFFRKYINPDHILVWIISSSVNNNLISDNQSNEDLYRNFFNESDMESLISFLQEKQTAFLITDPVQFEKFENIRWDLMPVKSVILFPIKYENRIFGLGFFLHEKSEFDKNQLSYVNLILGFFSQYIYLYSFVNRINNRLLPEKSVKVESQESRFTTYLKDFPGFLITLDDQYCISDLKTNALEINLNSTSIIGDNFLEYVTQSYRKQVSTILEESVDNDLGRFTSSFSFTKNRNQIFEVYVSGADRKTSSARFKMIAFDTTASYYDRLYQQRNLILDEIDQFSRMIIAEFELLMSQIVSKISLMRTKIAGDDELQENFAGIEKYLKHVSDLMSKFKSFNHDDYSGMKSGDLNKFIKSYIRGFKRGLQESIKIEMHLDTSLSNILFDRQKLRQLLDIIVDNSLRALRGVSHPKIEVSTRLLQLNKGKCIHNQSYYLHSGKYVEVCVKDNGSGIPEKSLLQVFKPFYSTRIKNEGVGLGLFTAYNIVKEFKGEIYITSQSGSYTSVHMILPIREEKLMEGLAAVKIEDSVKITKKKPTVLVVDDEYNIRSMMREIMEMYGIIVYTAGNGRDGLDIFQRYQHEIDLIILDMVMPVMDGPAMFEEVKKINVKQKIFIISGYSQREDLEEMIGKGAVGFLRKPFQVKEIVDEVKKILKIKG